MKIRYSRKRLFSSLFLGGIFVVTGFLQLIINSDNLWIYFLQLFFGLVAVGAYFYEKQMQYLDIREGRLTKNNLRRKSVPLDEIVKIRSYPGRIKLSTYRKTISINTELVAEDSLRDLWKVLGNLEVRENPFISYSSKTP